MPNVLLLSTNDATSRVAGRTPVNHATIELYGQVRTLKKWLKPGHPDIVEVVQTVFHHTAEDTYYVLTHLMEQGHPTYGWTREAQDVGFYDALAGTFWDLTPGIQQHTPPGETLIPFEPDVVYLHTTQAFTDYVQGMGGAQNMMVNPIYLGTAPAAFMTRWEVGTPEFDYAQEEPEAIFYRVVGLHKEWHVFCRARCGKDGQPTQAVTRFSWTAVNAGGELYSEGGLLRPTPLNLSTYIQVPVP